MTTSFTTSNEFETQLEGGFGVEADYPVVFGITFTPKVTGVAAGIGGFLVAAYLVWSQVMPAADSLGKLQGEKANKQAQLEQLSATQVEQKLQQKQAELREAKDTREEVMQLFATENNLETLLIDLNSFVKATDIRLNSYNPSPERQEISDGSFGELANGRIEAKTYNIDIQGTFAEIQLFLQDLERIQPLLVVQNFNSKLVENQNYLLQGEGVRVAGEPELQGTITVSALFPVLKAPEPEQPPEQPQEQPQQQ